MLDVGCWVLDVLLHSNLFTTVAVFPPTRHPAGTLSTTTLPAAIMLPSPISTPGAMKACAATHDLLRTVMGLVTRSKLGPRKSWEPVHRKARCEMQMSDSSVIGARLRMSTSSPSQTSFPMVSRQGKVTLTCERTTTPSPILAPNARSKATRRLDGQGTGFRKKRHLARTQRASNQAGWPRSKP